MADYVFTLRNVRKAHGDKVVLDNVTLSFLHGAKIGVDLPVPLGPTTPILAPCRNESVTLSRTTLSPWALRTLRKVKTYSAMMRTSLRPGRQRLKSSEEPAV